MVIAKVILNSLTSFWDANVVVTQNKFANRVIQCEPIQSRTNWDGHYGCRWVEGIASSNKPLSPLHHIGMSLLLHGQMVSFRQSPIYPKDCTSWDRCINVSGTVQGVEHHNEWSLTEPDGPVVFFWCYSCHFPRGSESRLQYVILPAATCELR